MDAWGELSISAGWEASVGAAQFFGFAGSDFLASIESPVDVSQLDVESNADWRVDVMRIGGSWPDDVTLSVRASSVRSFGAGSATATTRYTVVDSTSTTLASGTYRAGRRVRATIGLQYLIEGVAAGAGAGRHSTTIIYTLTDH